MMTSRNYEHAQERPLFIDFNAYTDGDDSFKKELIILIIENLFELQQTLHLASKHNDIDLFHKVCHKVKATLEMLEDQELLHTVALLKIAITDPSQVSLLNSLCASIIDSLRKE